MDCFHKLCLSGTPQKIVRPVEIFEIKWLEVIGLTGNESAPWEVLPDVFKCFVREMRWRLISRTEHLNTSGILPSLSLYLYICMYVYNWYRYGIRPSTISITNGNMAIYK